MNTTHMTQNFLQAVAHLEHKCFTYQIYLWQRHFGFYES